jgi:hypothetical protein
MSGKQGLDIDAGDRFLMTLLLSPGEYTAPRGIDASPLAQVAGMSIRDEKFAALRDSFVKAFGNLKVVYYRPHLWTPAFRLEIAPTTAVDASLLQRVLACIRDQCPSAGLQTPYPLYRAGLMSRTLENAMPHVYATVAAGAADSQDGGYGAVTALLLETPHHSGDTHG